VQENIDFPFWGQCLKECFLKFFDVNAITYFIVYWHNDYNYFNNNTLSEFEPIIGSSVSTFFCLGIDPQGER
jgi:hypothetical protein